MCHSDDLLAAINLCWQSLPELVQPIVEFLLHEILRLQNFDKLSQLECIQLGRCYESLAAIYGSFGPEIPGKLFMRFWDAALAIEGYNGIEDLCGLACMVVMGKMQAPIELLVSTFSHFQDASADLYQTELLRVILTIVNVNFAEVGEWDESVEFVETILQFFTREYETALFDDDLFVAAELVASLFQIGAVPPGVGDEMVAIGMQLLGRFNPVRQPTQTLAALNLMFAVWVFGNTAITADAVTAVLGKWRAFVEGGGLTRREDAGLHLMFAGKLADMFPDEQEVAQIVEAVRGWENFQKNGAVAEMVKLVHDLVGPAVGAFLQSLE
jgi:hypothetical protein